MTVTLELTGAELVTLYIATGNESARSVILRCIEEEREFDITMRAVARSVTSKLPARTKQ